ncbi:spermatogenesis-associated protein 22-like [Cimex lectularius]|uniref:Uncharacterized protein n=1 Tax=Cimex lectularius TaxID=79782 RepID=A0A8I6SQM9_CIMLE|nr:spermatogenesis-associated protein 22-like [Cimex lectularius]
MEFNYTTRNNSEQSHNRDKNKARNESLLQFQQSTGPTTSSAKFIPLYKQNTKTGPSNQPAVNSFPNNDITEGQQKNIINETPRDDSRRLFIEKKTSPIKLKYLIGKVDHAIRWCRQLKDFDYIVIYQIVGILEHVMSKGVQKLYFLKGDSGQVLQCVFYNIDRDLPDFPCGSFIRVTGKMKGSNKMQIFDAEITDQHEVEEALPRLTFVSQRILNEITKK